MEAKFIVPVFAAILVFFVHPFNAPGQGATAFTYQGHLINNGTNVTGTNGIIFSLYSAASGGSVISTPLTNSVGVSNGLFSVDLDFGAGAFNGSARWLNIAVSNGLTNVTLSPRMQILPTPYATFAAAAATAATAGTATNFAAGVTGTFAGNGSGLTNVAANLQMQVFSASGTFTAPTNVNSVIVEAWGGGGAGGSGSATYNVGGGGGGAGGYVKGVVSVTPGGSYQVTVGLGAASGGFSGTSSFGSTLLSATGGTDGQAPTAASLPVAGGAGGHGSGSGSASTLLSITGGTGKYGTIDGGGDGGDAGVGGTGGLGNLGNGAATAGNTPGAGGGGGDFKGTVTGAAGANGEVIVYY